MQLSRESIIKQREDRDNSTPLRVHIAIYAYQGANSSSVDLVWLVILKLLMEI